MAQNCFVKQWHKTVLQNCFAYVYTNAVQCNMSDSDDEVAVAAAAAFIALNPPKKRRHWVRPSLKSRSVYGAEDLLRDLRKDDVDPITKEVTISGYFKNFTRMSCEDFENICRAIGPFAKKRDIVG